MSTKRLNKDERITYMIGEAIRRVMDNGPYDPEALRDRDRLLLLLEGALSPEQFDELQDWTGWHSTLDFEEMRRGECERSASEPHPDPEDDDEVPF